MELNCCTVIVSGLGLGHRVDGTTHVLDVSATLFPKIEARHVQRSSQCRRMAASMDYGDTVMKICLWLPGSVVP